VKGIPSVGVIHEMQFLVIRVKFSVKDLVGLAQGFFANYLEKKRVATFA